MSLFQAVSSQVPWTKARLPDARCQAPSPGLVPGQGPGNPILGRVNCSLDLILTGVFESSLCLVHHLKPVCHGRLYEGAKAPWQHEIPGTHKPLHHVKVADVWMEGTFSISKQKLLHYMYYK